MPLAVPFCVNETHGILVRPENHARRSSDGYQWTSLYASAQREEPYEGFFPAVEDQLIVLHRNGPVSIDRTHGDNPGVAVVPAGGMHLVPGGLEFGVRLMGELDTLHVYVRRAVIEEVAAHMVDGDPAKIEIPAKFLDPDPVLHNLLDAINMALTDDDFATALYIDYMSRAIASQLIRKHSVGRVRHAPALNPTRAIGRTISEAIEFMRENLDRSISLDAIANAINRSPSHFARQFRHELGMPPHQYIVNLRLEKAQYLLEQTKNPIAEIAFECGFSHQEHLTRFFRRRYNTTPAAYRKSRQQAA